MDAPLRDSSTTQLPPRRDSSATQLLPRRARTTFGPVGLGGSRNFPTAAGCVAQSRRVASCGRVARRSGAHISDKAAVRPRTFHASKPFANERALPHLVPPKAPLHEAKSGRGRVCRRFVKGRCYLEIYPPRTSRVPFLFGVTCVGHLRPTALSSARRRGALDAGHSSLRMRRRVAP